MNSGLLLLHVFLGLALVAHSYQKAFVFKLSGTAAYLEGFGFPSGRFFALLVIGSEFVSGTLIALGLVLPLAAAMAAGTMLVASRTDHRGKGWFITGPGSEYVTTNAVIAISLAIAGGGRYSLDHALGLDVAGIWWGVGAAAVALLGAGSVLALRRPALAPVPVD